MIWAALSLAVGAWISVPSLPGLPVAMTLQTLALCVFSLRLPASRALGAVALYLLAGLVGLPVFAGFARAPFAQMLDLAGLGYLLGALPAAAWLAREPRPANWTSGFARCLVAHAVVLTAGATWLAATRDDPALFTRASLPYLPGAVAKSALAALIAALLGRRASR